MRHFGRHRRLLGGACRREACADDPCGAGAFPQDLNGLRGVSHVHREISALWSAIKRERLRARLCASDVSGQHLSSPSVMMQRSYPTMRPSTPGRNRALARIWTAEVPRPLSVLDADKNGFLNICVQRAFEGRPTTSAVSTATLALREGSFLRARVSCPTASGAPALRQCRISGTPRHRMRASHIATAAVGFTPVLWGCTRTTETRARKKGVILEKLQAVRAALAGLCFSALEVTEEFQSRSLGVDTPVSAVAAGSEENRARQARRCALRGGHASARRCFGERLLPGRWRGRRRHGPAPWESGGLAQRGEGRDRSPQSARVARQHARFVEQRLKESRDQTGGDRYPVARMYRVDSGRSNGTIDVLSQNTWYEIAQVCNAHALVAPAEADTLFNQDVSFRGVPGRAARPGLQAARRQSASGSCQAARHVRHEPAVGFPGRAAAARDDARHGRNGHGAQLPGGAYWQALRPLPQGRRKWTRTQAVRDRVCSLQCQTWVIRVRRVLVKDKSDLAEFVEYAEDFRARGSSRVAGCRVGLYQWVDRGKRLGILCRDLQRSRGAPPIHRYSLKSPCALGDIEDTNGRDHRGASPPATEFACFVTETL